MNWKTGVGAILLAAMVALPVVSRPQDGKSQRMQKIERELTKVRDEQQKAAKQLLELVEKHGTLVMSRDRILQEMAQIEEETWKAKLAREEMSIRTEVLRDRLKAKVESLKESDEQDEVGQLLERKLSLAKTKRNRIEELSKAGTVPTSEIEDAESIVADAQLAFAQYKAEKKSSPDAEEIRAISRELAEMESDVVVKQKLAGVQSGRVAELKESLLKTAEYSDFERMEASLSRRREYWEQQLLELETQEDAIGSEAPPAGSKSEKEDQ